jgi:ABC-type Fe3+ transport system substrate-binding protein
MKRIHGKLLALLACLALSMILAACGNSQQTNQESTTTTTEPTNTGATKAEWEIELDKVYEAAKAEGELIVLGQPGTNREDLMNDFQKAYPGITVKYSGIRNNEVAAKISAEQGQGKYTVDILIEGIANDTEDLRNMIIDPSIKNDENWYGGFDLGWQMLEGSKYDGRYVYGILASPTIFINNDVIPQGEIKTMEDLLDPKWKGKLILRDFTRPGQSTSALTGLAHQEGKEFVEKLIAMEPVQSDDDRLNAQWFATGKYPIAIGLDTTTLDEFSKNGIVKKIQHLRQEKATIFTPFSLAVMKNSPHPNASKLFVNWYLSKEGQEKFVEKLENYSSRRTDVTEPKSNESIPWDQIDVEKAIPYYSKEGAEISDWVIEQGKIYKSTYSNK